MAVERKVYEKVSWLCQDLDSGPTRPVSGVYVPINDKRGRFYFGDEPVNRYDTKGRECVETGISEVHERESDAWVDYGKMQTAIAITSMRESERAMLNAMDALGTEELRRMTGTKGA